MRHKKQATRLLCQLSASSEDREREGREKTERGQRTGRERAERSRDTQEGKRQQIRGKGNRKSLLDANGAMRDSH